MAELAITIDWCEALGAFRGLARVRLDGVALEATWEPAPRSVGVLRRWLADDLGAYLAPTGPDAERSQP